MKRFLLICLILFTAGSLVAQTTISSSDITLVGASTPMSVAWHPSYSRYYASAGGMATSPVTTFNSSGTEISSTTHNFDNRGLWYNAGNARIEGSDLGGNVGYYPMDGSGNISGDVAGKVTGFPNGASGGVRNSANGEILYYSGSTSFSRYNSSGSFLESVSITLPGEVTFNGTHMIYTGFSGQEVGFYDYTNKIVYLYSISGGSYSYYYNLPASAPANGGYYGFAYANGRFFLSSDGTWYGYPTGAQVPANPTSITASANPICNSFSSLLTANGVDGTVYWYIGSCGGTQVATGSTYTVSPTTSTTYYARNYNNSQFSAGCASLTVTVNQPSFTPGTITVASLQATGTGIQWYAAASGGSALATSTALVNGTHYYASQTVNGVESTARFDATATIDQTPCAPSGSDAQSYTTGATVASLQASGTSIRWYAAASGGAALATSTALVNGTHYYASQTVSCTESATRLAVTANAPPLAIGDSYGGGIVAYIFQVADPGYSATVQHGLIAATSDQSTGIAWITGGLTQETANGNTSTNYGTGQANTNFMIAQTGFNGGAAKVCDDYINTEAGTGVYSDWYLPSKDELNKLYLNKVLLSTAPDKLYWSSSEWYDSTGDAWFQEFDYNYYQGGGGKYSGTFYVRAVRSF